MATLWVKEYNGYQTLNQPVASEPPQIDQTPITISGTAAASAAFNAATRMIRIVSDVSCSFAIGPNVVATTNNSLLPALTPEYFMVQHGNVISVIANS